MNGNNTCTISKQQVSSKIESLKTLLTKQLKLARQGSISDVEASISQSDILVRQISDAGIPKMQEFKEQRQELERLYKSIFLALTTQKDDTAEQLKQVRKGKRTIEVYRKSI